MWKMAKQTIKEIEKALQTIENEQDVYLKSLQDDERKGVQTLLKRWYKKREEAERLKSHFQKMCVYENKLHVEGYHYIAGIDEVGRGPLAGPVVASAVILPNDFFLPGLDDSKKLSEIKREEFYEIICAESLAIGVGIIPAETIDEVNIYQASKLAMMEAVSQLPVQPEYLLIDAMKLPIHIPQTSIIKGDGASISIAASSVIAKVTRDRMMKKYGKTYPEFGFEKHMGYGTKYHLDAIHTYGITNIHRRTFSPVKEALENM